MKITIDTDTGSVASEAISGGVEHRVTRLTKDEILWQVACLLMGQPGFRPTFKEDV